MSSAWLMWRASASTLHTAAAAAIRTSTPAAMRPMSILSRMAWAKGSKRDNKARGDAADGKGAARTRDRAPPRVARKRDTTIRPVGGDALVSAASGPKPGEQPRHARVLHVSLLGLPNAGKSTLLNAIVGDKVSIVSKKRQTTRERVLGVWTEGVTQVVFLDTPGVVSTSEIRNRKQLEIQSALVTEAWDSLEGADVALVVVDAVRRREKTFARMIEHLHKVQEGRKLPAMLVLNKVDLCKPKTRLLVAAEELSKEIGTRAVHMTSALLDTGVKELRTALLTRAKPGNWAFDAEVRHEQTPLEQVQEVVREQCLQQLNKEIPYQLEHKTVGWTRFRNGSLRIDHELIARSRSQKRVVKGKRGVTLHRISVAARKELEKRFGHRVHLFLDVRDKA